MYPSVQSDEMNKPRVFAVFDIYMSIRAGQLKIYYSGQNEEMTSLPSPLAHKNNHNSQ